MKIYRLIMLLSPYMLVALLVMFAPPAAAQLPPLNTIATDGLNQAGTGYYAQNTVWDKVGKKYYRFYLAAGGYTRVIAYDITTKTYSAPSTVGYVGTDYHFYATAVIDSHGYFHVIHGMHNGTAKYSKSLYPGDVSQWTTTTLTTNMGTYPYLFIDSQDNLTAFYRAGGGPITGDKVEMARSTNFGGTWTYSTIVDLNDPAGSVGVYLTAEMSEGGVFHIALAERTAWADNQTDFRDILYFRSPDGGITWTKRDGAVYTLPVSRSQADVVYAGRNVFASSIDTDASGNPYIVIARQNSPVLDWFESSELLLASWSNGAWIQRTISSSPSHKYHARLKVFSNNSFAVYVPKAISGITHTLVRYSSTDGVTFTSKILACGPDARAPQVAPEKNSPAAIVNFHSNTTLHTVDLAQGTGATSCP